MGTYHDATVLLLLAGGAVHMLARSSVCDGRTFDAQSAHKPLPSPTVSIAVSSSELSDSI
jgi:hypothetical protein